MTASPTASRAAQVDVLLVRGRPLDRPCELVQRVELWRHPDPALLSSATAREGHEIIAAAVGGTPTIRRWRDCHILLTLSLHPY